MKSYDLFIDRKITIFGKEENEKKVDFITKHRSYESKGDKFIALDLKTTGLFPDVDEILEISAVKFSNKKKVETFYSSVNPENDKIEAPQIIDDVIGNLIIFLEEHPIVAHNVSFDIKFIRNACQKHLEANKCELNNEIIDTMKLSREMYPRLANHRLETVSKHIGFNSKEIHRTTNDALISSKIYLNYQDFQDNKKERTFEDLSEDEFKVMNLVKTILTENDRPTDLLDVYKTKTYFDLTYFNNFIRFKLDGVKKYLLYDYDIETARKLYSEDFEIESPSKVEEDKSRIMITDLKDIKEMETIILDCFDRSFEEYK